MQSAISLAGLSHDTATAEPRRQNTSATVVDVGRPMVLYMSSRMMLASMTDRYRIITSRNENMLGWNMPLRATSIMPLEVAAPTMMPMEATAMMIFNDAAFEAMAELRKLAASFITPMKRPVMARTTITANMKV